MTHGYLYHLAGRRPLPRPTAEFGILSHTPSNKGRAVPLIQVTLAEGRSPERKERLLRAIHDAIVDVGERSESVRIWLTEVPSTELLIAGETAANRFAARAATTDESA
jgi:4-oxalocrotonate tautomerase